MTLRWHRLLFVLAAAALAAGLGALLLRARPAPEFVVDASAPPLEPPADRPLVRPEFDLTQVGGTYSGRVVDESGQPIAGADVLLVALDTDAKVTLEDLMAEGTGTILDVPVFGEYRTAARGRTGPDGRFSLPAGNARVAAILAHQRGFAPGLLAHTREVPLRPGVDHVLRLSKAGWLRGRVTDKVSGAPVPDAEVSLFFQTVANQERAGPDPMTPTNSFARFQLYVAREIGPLVWGVQGSAADGGFRVRTDRDGTFQFGPVMKEVQVEVVVTHPDYMWTDPDPEVSFESDNAKRKPGEKTLTRRRRVVVPPGETVEREYRLEKGEEVSGTVLDANDQPLEGVVVSLEHVAEYYQHVWYRHHARNARTDAKGRFRIAGLSFEPYNLRMTHPAIETEYFSQVKAGSDTVYKLTAEGGWIDVVVEGGPGDRETFGARAVLEPVDRRGTRRETRVAVRGGQFTLEKVRPAVYDLTVISTDRVSRAVRVEVAPSRGATAQVALLEGGGVEVTVLDAAGRAVDPATVELEMGSGDSFQRRSAVLVTRQGTASATGLLPGTYRARVRAMGYVPVVTEPFEVTAGGTVRVPTVTLSRQGYLRVTGIVDAAGRPQIVDLSISVAQGGAPAEPVQALQAGLLPVLPGQVTLSAQTADGRRYEGTFAVGDGETVPVEIRLDR